MEFVQILLDATLRSGTPIALATLGAILMERSGIINLGIEGLMMIGALAGFACGIGGWHPVTAVAAAFVAGALAGSIHALLCVLLRANQIVSGLALTMFGVGLSALLGKSYVGQSIQALPRLEIAGLAQIPLLGVLARQDALVYLSVLLALGLWYLLWYTRPGLALRSIGENPAAADTNGINVLRYRFWAVCLGSGLAGLGGCYLSMVLTPFWVEHMSAGRGWIAISLVIFAQWKPLRALAGAYLFGGIDALQLRLQAAGTDISPYLLQVLPYVFTILVLVIATARLERGRKLEPQSLGIPYDREDRR